MKQLMTAKVRSSKGKTLHLTVHDGEIVEVPVPDRVVIVEGLGSCFLLREDAEKQCIADTWHESVGAAMVQAEFEYELEAWLQLETQ